MEEVSEDDIAAIRAWLEGVDSVEHVAPEVRAIVEKHLPDLAHKLPKE